MTGPGGRRLELRDHVRRNERTPPPGSVVLRGGPDTEALLRSHARRVNRKYVLDGAEVWAVSAFVAVDDVGPRSEAAILRDRLRSYRGVYSPTSAVLAESGFVLLPTFGSPHFSVLLSSPHDVADLMAALGELGPNPYAVDRGEPR